MFKIFDKTVLSTFFKHFLAAQKQVVFHLNFEDIFQTILFLLALNKDGEKRENFFDLFPFSNFSFFSFLASNSFTKH